MNLGARLVFGWFSHNTKKTGCDASYEAPAAGKINFCL